MEQQVELAIYTHPDCQYSQTAKTEFRHRGIPFREIDLSRVSSAIAELERLTGGKRITPVIVEGALITVGYGGVG